LQENTAHPREILQMKINDTAEKSNRFNAKGIVHGRLCSNGPKKKSLARA
jgi:hypothetical protein